MPDDIGPDDIILDAEEHMEKSVKSLAHEFSLVRTGRATPALVEGVKVDYHGTPTTLRELALIKAPEPRLLTIEPWEKSLIRAIEKGLADANLGLNPSNDGRLIRIAIPPLTEDRRKEMVKKCQGETEQGKVAVRNVRREAIDRLRKLEKAGEISEDELKRSEEEMQKLTEQYIKKVEDLLAHKRTELMED